MNVLAMVTADRIATTHTVTEGAEFPLLLIRGLERMLAGVVAQDIVRSNTGCRFVEDRFRQSFDMDLVGAGTVFITNVPLSSDGQ